MSFKKYGLGLRTETLTVFRDLLDDPVVSALQTLLKKLDDGAPTGEKVEAYCRFASELYQKTSNLTTYLTNLVLDDDNFYVRRYAMATVKGLPVADDAIDVSMRRDLKLFQELSQLTSADLLESIEYRGELATWETSPCNLEVAYTKRLADLPNRGYGIYAKYNTFTIHDEALVPVKYPDSQRLSELFGYERERNIILKNVEALVEGTGCNNMLLYGDAGTGKSSTIKAACNAFADRGLRLIEVKKNQLYSIPAITDELAGLPLKFVLFIDDLSFESNDDNFSALKAILEGSVSTAGDNLAIFATSNRRHLVKETQSERTGDDIHVNDTLQETTSLAARFGLTVTFQRPGKEEYLAIVDHLAKGYGLSMDPEELHRKAETHALRHNGRTPRLAKQFVELLCSGLTLR